MSARKYENPLASPADLEGFKLEGDGAMSFPLGRLRLESTQDDANIVLWCPEEFPPDITVEWDFWPIREPGLCILFFHAKGRHGEDLFDLQPRTGPYDQYHHGDLDTYHVSYFRRRWPAERAFHTCNLRKSYGFHLVAQGADPIPGVPDADGPYRLKLAVHQGLITFAINDLVSFSWHDEDPLRGGKLGFRQMAPMIGEYANLRISHS
ncbi:DUF1961 family protein [Kribbella sp. CA-245084]|uniref:DUF1961 family protein n=1 Tax=Kribbella sp. CA-245084 TaxID=3239940 RepID=UPI003D94DBB5